MAIIAIAMNSRSPLDDYVFDALMRDLVGHDRRPAAFLIYIALASKGGFGRRCWSHLQLAEQTGLSKRTVQDGLRHLVGRGLVESRRAGATEPGMIEVLTPWRR